MNFENFVLGLLDSSANFNFNAAIRGFLVSLAVIWLFVVVWVWMDSGERSRNIFFRLLSVVLVLVLNILGLIIYLLMRPKDTVENLYWSDLERRFLLYETSQLGDCENCGIQLRPDFNVCPSCSYPVNVECPTCKQMIDKYWNFCPYCSTKQEHQFLGDYPESVHGVSEEALLAAGMVNSDISRAIRNNPEPVKGQRAEPEPTPVKEEKKPTEAAVKEDRKVVSKESSQEKQPKEDAKESKKEKQLEPVKDPIQKEEQKSEKVPSAEEMAESVEGTREKINEDLKEKGMKYQQSPGVAVRLGNYVMVSVYKFGEKINKTALKVSGRTDNPVPKGPEKEEEKGAEKQEIKQEETKKKKDQKKKNSTKKKSKNKEKGQKKNGKK